MKGSQTLDSSKLIKNLFIHLETCLHLTITVAHMEVSSKPLTTLLTILGREPLLVTKVRTGSTDTTSRVVVGIMARAMAHDESMIGRFMSGEDTGITDALTMESRHINIKTMSVKISLRLQLTTGMIYFQKTGGGGE